MPQPALIVALTGGIASGKSTVGRLFEQLGVPVVDADAVAREVVEPGQPALEAIRARFGDAVVGADGRLDRPRLRARVFDDEAARRDLEAILHPRIRQAMDRRLRAADAPYAIAMIPLLLETGQQARFDRVLVVDVPRDKQLERALARDGGPSATVEAIIRAQVDRDTRLARADDVIENDGPVRLLRDKVGRLHADYLERAARLRADPQQ